MGFRVIIQGPLPHVYSHTVGLKHIGVSISGPLFMEANISELAKIGCMFCSG